MNPKQKRDKLKNESDANSNANQQPKKPVEQSERMTCLLDYLFCTIALK